MMHAPRFLLSRFWRKHLSLIGHHLFPPPRSHEAVGANASVARPLRVSLASLHGNTCMWFSTSTPFTATKARTEMINSNSGILATTIRRQLRGNVPNGEPDRDSHAYTILE